MSREWKRIPTDCNCGYCQPNRIIKKGEPACYILLPFVKRPLVRCESCAGEPAPDDLPELMKSGGIGPTTLIRAKYEEKQTLKEWRPYSEIGEEG